LSIIEKALEKLENAEADSPAKDPSPRPSSQAAGLPFEAPDEDDIDDGIFARPDLPEELLDDTEAAVERVRASASTAPVMTEAVAKAPRRRAPVMQPRVDAVVQPARAPDTVPATPGADAPPGAGAPAGAQAPANAEAVPPKTTSRQVVLDLQGLERSGFLTPNQAQSLLAEEYRHLKRPILRRATPREADHVDEGNLVIMTSSLPGEGKTYMSINLAMSIAMEVDRTILLVDADVAKADVSRVLGVHDEPGLSSYLSGKETDLSKLILRTNVETLSVLPAGPHYSKLTELLASEQMSALVKDLSLRYPDRIVLFDSPPLLATSGASVLTHLMGQVLMVVEAVRTPKSAVKAALRQLVGVRSLNFVLNKQRRSAGGAYGSGYGYGYSYGFGTTPYAYGSRPAEN
jgi:receptor protein-tyrosine kinase